MIKFDPIRGRWVAWQGGVPLASSAQLKVMTRRFPAFKVDEASAE